MGLGFLSTLFGKKKGAVNVSEAIVTGVNEIPHVEFSSSNKNNSKIDNNLLAAVKAEIASTTETVTKITSTMKTVEESVEKMTTTIDTLEKQNIETQKKFASIDSNMRKFLSLYEIVNNQYNPFVTNDGKHPTPILVKSEETITKEEIQDNLTRDDKEEPIDEIPEIIPPKEEDKEDLNPEDALTIEVEDINNEEILTEQEPKNLPGFGPNGEYNKEKAKEELEKIKKENTQIKEEDTKMEEQKTPIKEEIRLEEKLGEEIIDDDELSFFDFDTLSMEKAATDSVPLKSIKNNTNGLFIILSLLEYMVKRMGIEATRDTLRYYTETLSWITPEVFFELDKFLRGMNEMTTEKNFKIVNVRDHIVSLYFISKLNNKELDKKLVHSVLRIIKNQK